MQPIEFPLPFQEFIAIVLMVSYFRPLQVEKISGCQFLEIFSGRARTARLASGAGYRCKAVDFLYSGAFNILKPAGFMLLSGKKFS